MRYTNSVNKVLTKRKQRFDNEARERYNHKMRITKSSECLDNFLNDLENGEITTATYGENETVVVVLDNNEPADGFSSFCLLFEMCHQCMRFTKDTRQNKYAEEAHRVQDILKKIMDVNNKEVLSTEIKKIREFMEHSKKLLLKMHYSATKRCINEIVKAIDDKTSKGLHYTGDDLHKWLLELGR